MSNPVLPGNYIKEGQPLKLIPGLILKSQKVEVSLTPAAASFNTGITIPTGAITLLAQVDIASTISATTAVKIGLGTTSDPDKYGLSSALTAQDVGGLRNLATLGIPLTADDTIKISACDTNGDAAGTIGGTGQKVKVRMAWLIPETL